MNCKTEFKREVSLRDVKACIIYCGDNKYFLAVGYTKEDSDNFLKSLDFDYDNEFGDQEIFGTIWYGNNTWSERREHDGLEYWICTDVPEIPEELL